MTRRQWLPMMVLAAVGSVVTGCGGPADSAQPAAPASAATPARSVSSVVVTAAPTPGRASGRSAAASPTAEARGAGISTIPDWITDADQQVAARFVILANTPDGQIDESATGAWARAARLATPKLAADMKSGRAPMGGDFAQVKAKKGWMSVSIQNVLGGAQAPGASAGTGPIPILFTQSTHIGDTVTRDQTVQEWDVTVTGGKVADFDAKET